MSRSSNAASDLKDFRPLLNDGSLVIKDVGEAHLASEGITGMERNLPCVKASKPLLVFHAGIDDGVPMEELPLRLTDEIGLADCQNESALAVLLRGASDRHLLRGLPGLR